MSLWYSWVTLVRMWMRVLMEGFDIEKMYDEGQRVLVTHPEWW